MSQHSRPQSGDYAEYYETYISKVPDVPILEVLQNNFKQYLELLEQLPVEKWNYKYAPGKWTIKELMIHICDAERVFAYRLLRVGRNDKIPLPGFDQDEYTPHYHAEKRSAESVIEEYKSVRSATLSLLSSLDDEALARVGTASDWPVSGLALAFMIAGHEIHHFNILQDRYL